MNSIATSAKNANPARAARRKFVKAALALSAGLTTGVKAQGAPKWFQAPVGESA